MLLRRAVFIPLGSKMSQLNIYTHIRILGSKACSDRLVFKFQYQVLKLVRVELLLLVDNVCFSSFENGFGAILFCCRPARDFLAPVLILLSKELLPTAIPFQLGYLKKYQSGNMFVSIKFLGDSGIVQNLFFHQFLLYIHF